MNNEFKGTLGKWSINHDYDENYSQACINIDSDSGEMSIATVWSGSDENCEKTIADAILMSKAPEMLEMLIKVKEKLLGYRLTTSIVKEIDNLIKEATCTSK